MKKSWLIQPSAPETRRREAQAAREATVRQMKDLANEPYMGKNE